ncbi:MAG: hypothetical protein FJ104_17755, partial [Deltaproteobacteria bacterium]|nr:hypothetical protein [Deltaproteobacteria bacterium]
TVAFTPSSGAAAAPRVLSYRAASSGGVALAPDDPARSESLVAWTGLDDRRPQAFVTRLSARGEKLAQRMVSRTRGEASGVAVAAVGPTSHVVGWTETGGPEPGVHLVRLGPSLETVGKARYLGAGTSEPSLLATPSGLVAAYLDGGAPRLVRLGADLAETSPAARLSPRTAAAASPRVASAGDDLWLTWVERPEGAPGRVAVTRIGAAAEEIPGARVELDLDVAAGDCAFSAATDAARPVLLCQTRGLAPEIVEITVPSEGTSRRTFVLLTSRGGAPPATAGDALFHAQSSGVLSRVDLAR